MPDSEKRKKFIPELVPTLRKNFVKVPEVIRECGGIVITGKRIKSILFTTDVAIIKNNNADAIIAVYPFSPQPAISQAILSVADIPVFCGVGGGLTNGVRSANVALHAEFQGAMAVVLNGPTPNDTIKLVRSTVDIPVIYTVVSESTNIQEKLDCGVDILNVSGGIETSNYVRKIRADFPEVPIIATGGPNDDTIREVIAAGANAVTYTAPTNAELFKVKMEDYRNMLK